MSDIGTEKQKSSEASSEQIEKIIRQYSNMIFRLAYQSLNNYHDAQDIMQEVGVALVTGDAPLNNENHLRNWLAKVTLNKCRNLKKSAYRRKTAPLTEELPYEASNAFEVFEELKKLPENQRNVLYLYFYEQFTIDEIAVILSKSRNTIASRLRRGKANLRQILKEGGYQNV